MFLQISPTCVRWCGEGKRFIYRTTKHDKLSIAGARNLRSRVFAGLIMSHDPTRGSEQEVFENSRVESGRIRECSKPHRSDRVASRGLQTSLVGLGTHDLT